MRSLRQLFDQHQGHLVGKVDHFFDDYEPWLALVRGGNVRVLEIGVHRGGSLELWQEYFGASALVHGIDIDQRAAEHCPDGARIHIGSQVDDVFLRDVVERHGPFGLIIDDGSHQVSHQIKSFETLYPTMSGEGVYICEDSFSSYWPEFGGQRGKPDTFIEFAKRKVDELHAWWIEDAGNPPTEFTRTTRSVTFLSGAVVFLRGVRTKPRYVARHAGGSNSQSVRELREATIARGVKPIEP